MNIGGAEFSSRLLNRGTRKFLHPAYNAKAIIRSESQMITVAMKRINMLSRAAPGDMLLHLSTVRKSAPSQHFRYCGMPKEADSYGPDGPAEIFIPISA